MSIPPKVLLAELRRYAVACEAEAARARVVADDAWRQLRQAQQDVRDDMAATAGAIWQARLDDARRILDRSGGRQ